MASTFANLEESPKQRRKREKRRRQRAERTAANLEESNDAKTGTPEHAVTSVEPLDGTAEKPEHKLTTTFEEPTDAMTAAIQQLNAKAYGDERVDLCMLSNSDGITVALKR